MPSQFHRTLPRPASSPSTYSTSPSSSPTPFGMTPPQNQEPEQGKPPTFPPLCPFLLLFSTINALSLFLHTSNSHSPPVLSSSTSSHMGLIYFCYMISIILWQTPCFASLRFPSLLLNVVTTWSHVSLFKLDSTLFPSQQKWCIMSFFLMAPYGVAQIHFCNLLCLTSVNFSILIFTPKTFRCLEKLVCLISIILSQSFLPMSEFMLLWFNCS